MLPVALVPVVAVVVWVAVAFWVGHRGTGAGSETLPTEPAGPVAGTPVVASAEPQGVATPSPGPTTLKSAPRSGTTVRYTFDGGLATEVVDGSGRLPLKVRKVAGGDLAAVPHDGGLAVRFPAACEHYGAESCARAVLQSGPANFLNPGRLDFAYGASVLVKPSETSKGANVMQKGFSVGDSQFKLQVDGAAGQPSCVLVGTAGPDIHVALASRSVADGRWHKVACSRSNALLTVAVDGTVVGRTSIPSSLSIVNADPLCIGGKGTSANNDQFAGVIDDVFVTRAA